MKLSEYQKAKKQREYDKAIELYKLGHSYRAIANMLGYSHQWVSNVIRSPKKDETVDNSLT